MKQYLTTLSSLLVAALLLVASKSVFAAACCGGGFASPSLIAGDDRAQLTTSASYSELAADVYTNGNWKKRDKTESNETYRIEGAHIFADRFQAGGSLPIIRRERDNETSTGLGDVNVSLGYEYLPDWDYNPWRPKGLGYLQIVVPTGKSIYESNDIYGLDSRGRGLWAFGAGTLLTKIIRKYDTFLSADIHRAFNKSVTTPGSAGSPGVSGTAKPGWGGNIGVGAGYNLADYRFGGALTWTYEDAVDFVADDPAQSSNGVLQRFTTASLSASYLASEEWAATATYSDQTLFGSPLNTSLSRTVMLQVQRRWSR